ncbi:MAG: 4Fe-4S ferredoxin, iron-sulfur binding:Zn-finger, C2H2 type [uncultured bacterium]|nr:MAG: 4Fe-4S ferredoxin, iron-sulfur binding:Zn-finger, C2H2 type [uncultured bacterium]
MAKLIPGKEIELETMTCVISEEICSGCKLCITVCPYKAITFDKNKKISVINEAICRGCGTCAATCPSAGIKARHFTDKQIYAEIGGVIHE